MTLPPLVAISPGDGRSLRKWILPLVDAGLPGLILREPGCQSSELVSLLDELQGLQFLAVHSRTPNANELAVTRRLPMHLTASEPPIELPHGRSTHSADALNRAFETRARYALLSPVWKPNSKPDDDRTEIGVNAFLRLRAHRPVFALGGVTPERYGLLREHGAGAMVLGDLFHQKSPAAAVNRLRQYLS